MMAQPGPPARKLRFGAVAPLTSDLATWRDTIRRLADSGYSTILVPDVPEWQPAPAPTLAMAAALTGLRVGTWVYAVPARPPWMTAWEAHSLSVLTDGRFELGLGTGRPGIDEHLRGLGIPANPGARTDQVREVITALRALDGDDRHTPVVMAVGGPQAAALAAELADTVTFAMAQQIEPRAVTVRRVRDFDNARGLELAAHVPVIGDAVAAFMAGPGTDPAAVRAVDSLAYLPADPAAAAEEVQRRRDEIGFSYVVFGAEVAAPLGPMVADLAGQ